MPSPVAVAIELSDDERVQLEAWARRRTSARALAQRSRIVLLAAAGLANTEIAAHVGVSRATAATWRARFAEHRLDGLVDEPRPGRQILRLHRLRDLQACSWLCGVPENNGASTCHGS